VVSVAFETQTEPPRSPPPVMAVPAPVPTAHELKEQLANDLGIELEQLKRFVDKDNREPSIPGTFTPPSPAEGLRPEGAYLPRRVGRWASRLSPRIMSQAPLKIVNVSLTRLSWRWFEKDCELTLALVSFAGIPARCAADRGPDCRFDSQLRTLLCRALPLGRFG